MDEARRALRYIFPGLASVLPLLGLLLLSDYAWTLGRLKVAMGAQSDLSAALVLLFASGGAGYLLGVLYHMVLGRGTGGAAHQRLIKDACGGSTGWKLVQRDDRELTPEQLACVDRHTAWRVLCSFWHQRLDQEKLKAAMGRINTLADIAHGAGALSVGLVFVLGAWAYFHYRANQDKFLCRSRKPS